MLTDWGDAGNRERGERSAGTGRTDLDAAHVVDDVALRAEGDDFIAVDSTLTIVNLLPQPLGDLGMACGDILGFTGIGVEVVELRFRGVAELGIGRDILGRTIRCGDEFPFPLTHGEPTGVLDQGLAADRIVPEQRW